MKEVIEALSPWPMIQGIALGLIVAGIAAYALRVGLRDNKRRQESEVDMDALKAKWKAYEHLDHVAENSFAAVKLLEKQLEAQLLTVAAINRLADRRWNDHQ